MRESDVAQKILLKFAGRPEALIMRRNVGMFYTESGARIMIGMPGEGDYSGIIGRQKCPHCGEKIHPLPFYLETKSSKGKQRDNQLNFQKNVWERRGGIYVLANDPEEDYIKVIEAKAKLESLM